MSSEPVVSVRGEAVLEVEPELARIDVQTTARESDRARALRLLNDGANAVDEVLRSFADAIERVENAGVRVAPQVKWGAGREKVTGYIGTTQRVVTVVDFDRLGELVAQLARLDLAEVSGPWWSLRRDSEVPARARLDAVQDALQRARDYARALGSEVASLVELADTGLLSQGENLSREVMPMAARAMSARSIAPEELTFDLTPVRQVARASVEARFRITPPPLA